MKKYLPVWNSDFYASRWLVLLIDVLIVINTFFISYFIRFNFTFNFDHSYFKYQLPIVVLSALMSFLVTGSYKGIIRHTGISDAIKVFNATILLTFVLSLLVFINRRISVFNVIIPFSIIAIHFLLNALILIGSRFLYRRVYLTLTSNLTEKINVLIYGAGDSGLITYMAIINDNNNSYTIKGFIDDKKDLHNKLLKGIKVYPPHKIDSKFIIHNKIKEIIVSIQNIENHKLIKIVDQLLTLPVKVKVVPPVNNWINGTLSSQQIKEVKLEDLLQRSPIKLFNENISTSLLQKTVMVTGAAGSIGSEIARQLTVYSCSNIILVDQAESALYDLQMELNAKKVSNVSYYISDVTNYSRLEYLFENHKIDFVFHAAAYKHVPLMEENPSEAVQVNIIGSKNLMDLAVQYHVEKFVMVSTDKAVNPTNVMGASKRVAEIYASCKNAEAQTKFITTRFGNVLGSNGSVIPLFKKQIENGGPLTVTHPEITRYFMTIPEACQLVLEAGIMGNGGEIFVFDMGDSVKIFDLAKNMIRLAGYKYPDDIDIKITGLRPGEKLFEELLSDKEKTLPTHHPKIKVAKTQNIDCDKVIASLNKINSIPIHDELALVKQIKSIVPEYISENSKFQILD